MSAHGPSAWLEAAGKVVSTVTDEWAEIGALAANAYRLSPRLTTDADMLISWDDGIVSALEAANYTLDIKATPGENPHLIIARKQDARVDFLVAETPFMDEALARSINHRITVEDVVVFKLIAYRAKDRDDLLSILGAGHALDVAYIERWAREWEVLDRWTELHKKFGA